MEVALVERAFIRVDGPDAERYLQGQLSQDVTIGGGLSFLLEPTGKVVSLLRFGRDGAGFLLDTDPPALEPTLARLRRFLLRTKVDIDVVTDRRLVRVFGAEPLPEAQIVAAWPPATPAVQDVVEPASSHRAVTLDPIEHERRRIAAGVPVSGVDIDGDTIPAEAGRWVIDAAVSFTKGCYTGQELVARIDSRGGNVPHPLRVLRFGAGVAPGADVEAGGTVVGRVTSAAGDLALARVARRVEPGAEVRAGGVEGVVER